MSETCYSVHSGQLNATDIDAPCGLKNDTNPYTTCCAKGDWCMGSSICFYNDTDGGTGYYAADCTDPTLEDPVCGTRCGKGTGESIVRRNQLTFAISL